jgi:phosphomannomutase/phosphomannomutase/phosphoglucomutase
MKTYEIKRTIPPHIFRAYDIRGIVDKEIDEDTFYTIGLALSLSLKSDNQKEVVLGYDGRLSSDALTQALCQGLQEGGIDVTMVGLVPTPVLYFAIAHLNIASGMMVTGSHNAKDYNGIKIVINGKTLREEDIQLLYQQIDKIEPSTEKGKLSHKAVVEDYIDSVAERITSKKPLKIAIDCGNGVAGLFSGRLFKRLGFVVDELYCDLDGRFPNHHPDPTVETNLESLREHVMLNHCDLGLAFDGDADRLGVIDNQGNVIRADRVLMLLAQDVLSRHQGAKIVYDVKCSRFLKTIIEQAGGEAIMCPTGHSIVKNEMKKTGALLAGEMSGHLFFKERWFGFDDALYSGARLLEIISQSQHDAAYLFNALPQSESTPELKVPIAESQKFEFIERIKKEIDFSPGNCNFMDGVRCEYPSGWGLIRASNTTPCLVMRFEADTKEALKEIQSLFKRKLLSLDSELALPFGE